MVGGGSSASSHSPDWYKGLGVSLALASGVFIGSSFIFKKKGLLDTNALGHAPASGHAYLKSPMWWTGMILMGLGEVANFAAYAFTPAILVTPLGALSVVISAVLSSIFLKERLNFSAKIGCLQCVLGAIIIVINAPENNSTERIADFLDYVRKPFFMFYFFCCIVAVVYLIKVVSPLHGEKHPIVYISICSLVGSFLVLSAQGFGAAVAYSFAHWNDDNQFKVFGLYPVFLFVVITVIMQINYLNKALNLFSTAIVTPVYYVFFTGATILSSAILFQGFKGISSLSVISILIGFTIIVGGVALLFQYSLKLGKFTALANGDADSPDPRGLSIEDDDDEEIRRNAQAAADLINKHKNKSRNALDKSRDSLRSARASMDVFTPNGHSHPTKKMEYDACAVEMDDFLSQEPITLDNKSVARMRVGSSNQFDSTLLRSSQPPAQPAMPGGAEALFSGTGSIDALVEEGANSPAVHYGDTKSLLRRSVSGLEQK